MWAWVKKLVGSWATRSLAVGAVATAIDIAVGSFLVFVLQLPTATSAMLALAVGTTANFLGQRRYAFHEQKVAVPAAKWVAMTAIQAVVHGQLVHLFRDFWGVPYPLAKMGSDVVVFGALQLILLRFVVFPKRPEILTEPSPPAVISPSE